MLLVIVVFQLLPNFEVSMIQNGGVLLLNLRVTVHFQNINLFGLKALNHFFFVVIMDGNTFMKTLTNWGLEAYVGRFIGM